MCFGCRSLHSHRYSLLLICEPLLLPIKMAANSRLARGRGGYECEFVDQVSGDFVCELCERVAREPHLTVCCGHHYCNGCIRPFLDDAGKPCPGCDAKAEAFLNKNLKRKILALRVRCTMKDRGCEWIGRLEDLDAHLDVNTGECEHVDVKCPLKCNLPVQKRELPAHLQDGCPKRDFYCQHCNFKATHEVVCDTHWPECKNYPVQCPNACMVGAVERGDLDDHLKQCSLQEVDCEFSYAGCNEMLERQHMERHMQESTQKHLAMLSAATLRMSREFEQKLQEQREEFRGYLERKERETAELLQKKDKELEQKLREKDEQMKQEVQKQRQERDERIKAVEEQLQKNDREIQQQLQKKDEDIQKRLQQREQGSHELLQRSLQDKDQQIKTLQRTVQTQLQQRDREVKKQLQERDQQFERKLQQKDREVKAVQEELNRQTTQLERKIAEKGKESEIKIEEKLRQSHMETQQKTERMNQTFQKRLQENNRQMQQRDQELGRKFEEEDRAIKDKLQDLSTRSDTFQRTLQEKERQIRVLEEKEQQSRQEINHFYHVPPFDFTMPKFGELRQRTTLRSHNVFWESPWMYTYHSGYKIFIDVDVGILSPYHHFASSLVRGDQIHPGQVSVHLWSLKGLYDNELTWPLDCIITLELLNQHRDQDHVTVAKRITLNKPSESRCYQGCIHNKLIAYRDLGWNAGNKTQYLKDDCLKFRVTKVEVY